MSGFTYPDMTQQSKANPAHPLFVAQCTVVVPAETKDTGFEGRLLLVLCSPTWHIKASKQHKVKQAHSLFIAHSSRGTQRNTGFEGWFMYTVMLYRVPTPKSDLKFHDLGRLMPISVSLSPSLCLFFSRSAFFSISFLLSISVHLTLHLTVSWIFSLLLWHVLGHVWVNVSKHYIAK